MLPACDANRKAVPCRKTDVKDAEWIAQLLHHGMFFVLRSPDARQLSILTRCRLPVMGDGLGTRAG